MSLDVRTLTPQDVPAYVRAMRAGFNEHVEDGEIDVRRPTLVLDRTLAVFEGDRVIGTARSFPTSLTTPGQGELPAAAVTNVTVLPTDRRRGVLTAMMKVQLDDAASRHEPVAILIASEAGIYGRFGYGPATAVRALEIDRRAAGFRRGAAPDTDPVRLVDRDELRAKAPSIYERWRPRQPGAIGRTDRQWDARLGLTSASPKPDDKFHVLHPDGWLSYRVEDGWDGFLPRSVATVDELIGATPEAYETLWRYCLALDLVSKVVAIDRPVDEPLPWLLADPRQVKVISTYDFLWVRILDVAAALTGRGYAATGRLVIDVVDRFRPSAPATNGVFALEGGVCERVTDSPDLRLEVAALGSVLLGGAGWWALGAARQVEELTPGALARADALFACQPPPWCHTWF